MLIFNVYANDLMFDVKMPNMTKSKGSNEHKLYLNKKTKKQKKNIICFEKSFNLNSCKIQIFVGMHEEFNINSHYAHGDHFSCAFFIR